MGMAPRDRQVTPPARHLEGGVVLDVASQRPSTMTSESDPCAGCSSDADRATLGRDFAAASGAAAARDDMTTSTSNSSGLHRRGRRTVGDRRRSTMWGRAATANWKRWPLRWASQALLNQTAVALVVVWTAPRIPALEKPRGNDQDKDD